MILTRDGKKVIAIYKQDGDEADEVKDANGRLVYTNTREITGTLPLSFTSRGKPLTDYRISGNTVQDGTPTPEAPVDVQGVGERTGQLWDGEYIENLAFVDGSIVELDDRCIIFVPVIGGNSYTFSIKSLKGDTIIQSVFSVSKPANGISYKINNNSTFVNHGQNTQFTRTAPATANWLSVQVRTIDNLANDIMLNLGSTPLPYEPYGYKLPLTVNGTEYPIYLGYAQTTRRIKKLVLTGKENWAAHTVIESWYYVDNIFSPIVNTNAYCDRYKFASYSSAEELTNGNFTFGNPGGITSVRRLIFKDTAQATVTDFKSYLATQYAAGTPVTVWYVLATPETGIVNEPLMKIGNYADTITAGQTGVTIPTVSGTDVLDMATPVKPSEVYIKGKGIRAIT